MPSIKQHFYDRSRKKFALLIDPDTATESKQQWQRLLATPYIDFVLVGGSLMLNNSMASVITEIKQHTQAPVLLFPGSTAQLAPNADGILLLSLLSGRNPELLIGKQVEAAPLLKQSGMEILSTAYLLIDGGTPTSVQYISQTQPIPANKPDIAAATALAGQQLGFSLVYLEAGSGAAHPVPPSLIACVRSQVDIPLIVGGGIRTPQQAIDALQAGADVIVVGNAAEKDANLVINIAQTIKEYE